MSEHHLSLNPLPPDYRGPALWFAFYGDTLLVTVAEQEARLPYCSDLTELGIEPVRKHYLGRYDDQYCFAAEFVLAHAPPAGMALWTLRAALGGLDEVLAALAGRAFQLLDWERNHRFCSRCGMPTELRHDHRARVCPDCHYTSYPQVSPAAMVLVTRGRELLLVRKPEWPRKRFSALAGFVEAGEKIEDAVHRETLEEVGIEIGNLRYFGSQPWPFPHSLMIAFVADYVSGELRPDGIEIAEAHWFDAAQLPELPPRISLSHRLIESTAAALTRSS
jgi:NAD+ diphosphatase